MPQRRINREPPPNMEAIRKDVAEWYALKREAAIVSAELTDRTNRIKGFLEKYGEVEPEKGHIVFELGEPVGEAKITQLKNQRRSAKVMNQDTVEEILRDKGWWEELTEVVRVPDESAIHAAYLDRRFSDDELAQMFPTTVSYALYAMDDMGKPVKA